MRLKRFAPGAGEKGVPNGDQFGLKSSVDARFLIFMPPISCDRPTNHMQSCISGGKAQPQFVIHPIVQRYIDIPAGSVPELSSKHDFRLIKELPGVPTIIEIQNLVERKYTIATRRYMLGDPLAVSVNLGYSRHHIGV